MSFVCLFYLISSSNTQKPTVNNKNSFTFNGMEDMQRDALLFTFIFRPIVFEIFTREIKCSVFVLIGVWVCVCVFMWVGIGYVN